MHFWPVSEPAQLDYERLRDGTLTGALLLGPEAERFRRGGLAALIRRPGSPGPRLLATLVEVPRPRWSPYQDPRLNALADAYDLIKSAATELDSPLVGAR